MQNGIHRVYGKKGRKEIKNTPTADMRNPGPRGGEQAQGLGEEHSRTEEEAWGGKEVKIAIPAEADETAEELKLNKFTESTEAKIESCSHLLPQRHYYHPCFTSGETKCLSDLPLAGLEPTFLQSSGIDITKRFLLCVLPSGDLENID